MARLVLEKIENDNNLAQMDKSHVWFFPYFHEIKLLLKLILRLKKNPKVVSLLRSRTTRSSGQLKVCRTQRRRRDPAIHPGQHRKVRLLFHSNVSFDNAHCTEVLHVKHFGEWPASTRLHVRFLGFAISDAHRFSHNIWRATNEEPSWPGCRRRWDHSQNVSVLRAGLRNRDVIHNAVASSAKEFQVKISEITNFGET